MTEKVPRVQYAPETKKQKGGKVIQVRFEGLDYLVVGGVYLSEGVKAFHGDHLRNLLTQLGITDLQTFRDGYDMEFPIAKDETRRYELIGVGNCWILEQGEHTFSGGSGSYNLKINKLSLVSLIPYFPRGDKVIFEDTETEILGIGEGRQ